MKKSVLFVTAALSFGVASAQTQVTTAAVQAPALTDVPAGHWAKDAVERLVSQGIILGYPDGTYRGTQNLTRYEAALIISRLLDQIGSGEVDLGDVDDATLTSVRNAINELSAELAALDVRVSDLENSAVSREDFARLEGRVDAIAASDAGQVAEELAAVNEMATLLNQDVLELQDRVAAVDGELASFDERLGVVEDQVTENTTTIDAQGVRIADLENGRVSLTLGVGAGYGRLDQVAGDTPFDVDRTTEGTFAAREFSSQPTASAGTRVNTPDTEDFGDGVDDTATGLTFGIKANDLVVTDTIVVEEAGVNFAFKRDAEDDVLVTLNDVAVTGRVSDDVRFRAIVAPGDLTLRPDVINNVGELGDVPGYNDYLVPNGAANGVAVGVTLTDLPLDPTLYVAAGDGSETNLEGQYLAVRSEVELGDNGLAALSFVNNSASFNEAEEVTNLGRTAFGAEISYAFGEATEDEDRPFGVDAVYVASMPADIFFARQYGEGDLADYFDSRDQAAVLNANANVAGVEARLNARAVSPGFADGVAGMDIDGDDAPYSNIREVINYDAEGRPVEGDDATSDIASGEVGIGAEASAELGVARVGVYGDTYVPYYERQANAADNTANYPGLTAGAQDEFFARRTSFGGSVGVGLEAFRVTGFAHRTTIGDDVVRFNDGHENFSDYQVARGDLLKPGKTDNLFRYTSSVGAAVTHDGSSERALVPNLNLTLADAYFYDEGANSLMALAEYDAQVSPLLAVTPFVGYHTFTGGETADDHSTLKYGVGLETEELPVAFRPKLSAQIVNANHTREGFDTANELAANVQVGVSQFLAPSTELNLGYGFHRGDNLARVSSAPSSFAFGGNVFAPNAATGGNGEFTQTQGVYAQLAWNEALRLNYGVFFHDQNTRSSDDETNVAQGFKVSYGVKF